jgi:hypothetical protein
MDKTGLYSGAPISNFSKAIHAYSLNLIPANNISMYSESPKFTNH